MKTSNKSVHFFNPGHETAVGAGNAGYTPDAAVLKMMYDLTLLPLWYGNTGDYVLTDETDTATRFVESLPTALQPALQPISAEHLCRITPPEKPLDAIPWGVSPHSLHIFEKLSEQGAPLAVPCWNETYRTLTHRQTAAWYLQKIRQQLPKIISVVTPHFCKDRQSIHSYMKKHHPPFLLKTPFSCSGRGVYSITGHILNEKAIQWIQGALKKQGTISIEPMLDKVCDFAMEFYSDGKGQVTYEGISVFETISGGAFSSGMLGQPEVLRKRLNTYVSNSMLQTIRETVTLTLNELLGTVYQGYLGVDMLIYKHNECYAIHPFVEMNLRNTMGLVACRLSERLVHHASQGRFVISYEKKGEALYTHRFLQQQYPLQLDNGRIRSGYFSLCPVTTETNYRASLFIESF